jgi:hypothetical protein
MPLLAKEATMRCRSAVPGIDAASNVIVSSVALNLSQGFPPTVTEDSFAPGERSRSFSPPGGALNPAGRVMLACMMRPVPLAFESIENETRPYRVGESLTATRLPSDSHTRGTALPSHSVLLRGSSQTSSHFISVGSSVCDGAQ